MGTAAGVDRWVLSMSDGAGSVPGSCMWELSWMHLVGYGLLVWDTVQVRTVCMIF